MSPGLADTSVFVAMETDRSMEKLPDELLVSVVTLAELELGVLRSAGSDETARRLATLTRARSEFPVAAIDDDTASTYARIGSEMGAAALRTRVNDTWIAATAVHLGLPVYTQDDDFSAIPRVEVIRV